MSNNNIINIHQDIIQTHILSRLDGPTLTTASCVSSELNLLVSAQHQLWKDISCATWPSIEHPLVQRLISTFPSGHRSFFSDAFPLIDTDNNALKTNSERPPSVHSLSLASQIISVIDIRYGNEVIISKVHETGIVNGGWSLGGSRPFCVSLLDPKEIVILPNLDNHVMNESKLEDNLTLSWILIDPTKKRACNLSSWRPVSVHRDWLTGDMHVRYATVLAVVDDSSVECWMNVRVGGRNENLKTTVYVKEVSMQVEDLDGRILYGEECLVILQGALESGRRKGDEIGEAKAKYEKYNEMRRKRFQRRKMSFDILEICIGVALSVGLCGIVLLNISLLSS